MKKFAVGCSVGICIAVILIIILAVTMPSSPDTKQSTPTPTPTPTNPEIIYVSAAQVSHDYDTNLLAANNKYLDKILQVTGTIVRIGE